MKTIRLILFLSVFVASVSQAREYPTSTEVVAAAIAAAKGDDLTEFIRCVDLIAVASDKEGSRNPEEIVALLKTIDTAQTTLRPLHTDDSRFTIVMIHGLREMEITLRREVVLDGVRFTITAIH